jgi:hypothetical protein
LNSFSTKNQRYLSEATKWLREAASVDFSDDIDLDESDDAELLGKDAGNDNVDLLDINLEENMSVERTWYTGRALVK